MCATAGLSEHLYLAISVNTELPGRLSKKGSIMGYKACVSFIPLVIKHELLLGEGS